MTSMPRSAAHRVLALMGIFLLGTAAAAPALARPSDTRDNPHGQGKPFAGRYLPPGDPNLSPAWDWTVSGAGHTMYYSVNGTTPLRLDNVQLPFFTTGHPLATDQKDMYPEDGWMLAFRDFGTPTDAPPMPFFVLYNKYRGTLRVMFYNAPNVAYSYYKADLYFRSTTSTGGLMTFTDTAKATLSDYDKGKKESFMGHIAQFRGWAWADYTLFGYDPSLSPDAKFRLDIWGVDEGKVSLESTQFTLNEVMNTSNPGAPGTNNPFSTVLGAFNAGHKYYKDAEALKKALADTKSSAPNSWWAKQVDSILATSLASYGPYIGAMVGVVKFFMGGKNKASPREPLNLQGSLKMKGEILTTKQIVSADFALTPGTTAPDFYRPVQTIPWGVFNFTRPPELLTTVWATGCYDDYGYIYYCEDSYDYALNLTPYVFNPNAGLTLKSVKTAFTWWNAGPGTYSADPSQVTASYYYRVDYCSDYYSYNYPCRETQYGAQPSGVAVELVFQVNSPTRYADSEIVVYKEYPYQTVYQ